MPSLIRFLVVLLFLGILVLAGMLAVVALVEPREKDVTVRVPTQTIFNQST
ncbi:MAG: histidine kinase [Hyphomicrobiaceae bacterium]|nr:histidine kinase [Hyphomicrobiaceae bacterium]